ncbi:MAG: MFS transporter [Bilifractor sp.]|jgi:MFS family permease|nr:MFS transporter [Lachnospiraceae bacterium]MDY2837197.1 MFS transporter [Bilifractor sp.]
MEEKKVRGSGLAAIMTLYFVSMAITVVTPAMATFMEHWPDKAEYISYISTLPTLFIVIGTFLAGTIMGRKIKYRTLAIIASVIALIGGVGPAFFDSFELTLVCRAVMGFGAGLLAPLGNALIVGLYKGQKQASILGYGTLFMNAGGIVLQMLGGFLAGTGDRGWQMVFWGHALLIVAVIMSFFLPEPPKEEVVSDSGKKESMSKKIYVIAALIFLYNLFAYPIMLNMSTLFVQRNAGGPAVAATALSLYTVAGVVAGFVFGFLFKAVKRMVITLGMALCGLGFLLVFFGSSMIVMTVGLVIVGFGFSTFFPAFMAWMGMVTPPSTVAMASSLILACMNLGGFVASPYNSLLMSIFGADHFILPMILIAIVFDFAVAVIFIFTSPFKEKK